MANYRKLPSGLVAHPYLDKISLFFAFQILRFDIIFENLKAEISFLDFERPRILTEGSIAASAQPAAFSAAFSWAARDFCASFSENADLSRSFLRKNEPLKMWITDLSDHLAQQVPSV